MPTQTTTRELVLGTAGHIDHGKTSLVRALTGVDCDRLPQEKKRGITIDLGFAELDLGGTRLGVVDVPGHERFVKNMLAGASGIDLAMLVIAADDSVMPQTSEHLAILQLLGIQNGLVVVTKCDTVEPDWVDMVEDDIATLTDGTFLEGAPIVRTSATTGDGIDALKETLATLCEQVQRDPAEELFRLPIDRSMTFPGVGTVVTGTVWQGEATIGGQVEWLPSGEMVRLRTAQTHGRDAEQIHRGQRAAVNLAGVHHSAVHRGQELAQPGYLKPTRVLTVHLRVLSESPLPVKHRARIRLHLGTQEAIASVHLLAGTVVQPGESVYAQLFLSEPVVATGLQPFVLRAESPVVTVGGGEVLEPCAERIARRHHGTIAALPELHARDTEQRASAVIRGYGRSSWTELDLCRDAAVSPAEAGQMIAELVKSKTLLRLPMTAQRDGLIHSEAVAWMQERVLSTLSKMHAQSPLAAAFPVDQLFARLEYLGSPALLSALLERMNKAGDVVGGERLVSHGERAPKLTQAQRRMKQQLVDAIDAGGLAPPTRKELAKAHATGEAAIKPILELAVLEGELLHLDQDMYMHHRHEPSLRERVSEIASLKTSGATVSEVREALGVSRKYTMPILQYLDRIEFTRKQGDVRFLAAKPDQPIEDADADTASKEDP
ncbi:MAG: selenocysteine-specific translation elongation factor [Phycisphaerales bacterium JB063]